MAASLVVDRLRLELDMLRRDTMLWWLHVLPDITIQSLVQSHGGISISADVVPSPELDLPADPMTIEFLVSSKYGSLPPVVRCPGSFVHGICDPKSRVVNLPMLSRVERGWSKSYSIASILHTIRRTFVRKPSLASSDGGGVGPWDIRSKYLQYMESKHHMTSTDVIVAHCVGVGSTSVGARDLMEDALVCVDELACGSSSTLGFHPALYCVADGHAGITCADYLMRRLPEAVGAILGQDKSPREALYRAFMQVDSDYNEWALANNDMYDDMNNHVMKCLLVVTDDEGRSGSTCICVLYDGLDKLYCANVGDSRYGGFITNDRTFGQLTVTRAFGDVDIKKQFGPSLCALPEISEWTLSPSGDDVVVLASDGLFAVMDNRTVASIVTAMLDNGAALPAIADELVRICVADRRGEDNTSVVVIELTTDSHDRRGDDVAAAARTDDDVLMVEGDKLLKADKSVDTLLHDLALQDDVGTPLAMTTSTKAEVLRRPTTVSRVALQNDEELMDFLLDEQNFSGVARPKFMEKFFVDVEEMQADLGKITVATDRIAELNHQALLATATGEEQSTQELCLVIDTTNKIAARAKGLLELIKKETADKKKDKNVPASEMR
ncbi:hypothetical protein DYB31_009109 [Aphanomyces astaci]|uniref:PPM-type phosphatase domain-containing protein n=1 Tax=Aphanomyces astaci TaxID=112090 RepID=A0A397FFJ4_APHAT|nr:hypothetical protein DYB31_009109 [Aphanomyces astaci]